MVGFSQRLIDKGIVSTADIQRAEALALRSGGRLAMTLVRLGLVAEPELAAACAEASDLPLVTKSELCQDSPIDGLSRRFLLRHAVLPQSRIGDRLVLAMADPDDEAAVAALGFAAGTMAVDRVVATYSDIFDAIGVDPDTDADAFSAAPDSASEILDLERLSEGESDAPVIRLVQRLLTNAVNRRASDVHIEPMARYVSVRYRIDGRLIEIEQLPETLAEPMASRIKVLSGLDIAESRLPQDGRLQLTVRGRDVDVRVSTSPIAHGESIVLRILGRSEVPLDLDRLGLPAGALVKLNAALERPHGIILLTGPTGSGKTTTLYAAINRLRRPEVKILTVEDPVEVLLDGVNQVQVRPDIDLSYAATLRAFLRQDPDILMIGEIRDRETAEIAMRAALTGHLVLSTLHTNSATGAFTRLADIGIEPYLTASTVICTIAQRLIRIVCGECAVERALSAGERSLFEAYDVAPPAGTLEPVGCTACAGIGFKGRIPLLEIFEIDERARVMIRAGDDEGLTAAQRLTESLLGHGLALVAAGRTTLGEVQRAVQLA